jgi:uncharacterized protein (TIGR03437 family)
MNSRLLRAVSALAVFPILAATPKHTAAEFIHGSKSLSFEPNRGQTAKEVRFVSHGKRSSLFLTPRKAVFSLLRDEQRLALEMRFKGANPNPMIEGAGQLPGTVNYFFGSDPAKWTAAVPRFNRVLYRSVYSGIDLAYYGNDRQLEYDFIVSPGADPRAIRLEFAGQDKARIDSAGDLVLMAGGHELRQHKPVVYQERNGRRETVEGRYALNGNTVSFEVGPYDRGRALVIDPLLGYSSFLGGNNEDDAPAVATDPACNVYVTGGSMSADFPISPGTYPAKRSSATIRTVYVTKIDPDSETLLYSAFLGAGSSSGIAVDAAGNAYITGASNIDFPATYDPKGGTGSGAFVAKLSPDGAKLIYSVLLRGGTVTNAITLDGKGAAYIGGTVNNSKTFLTTAGVIQPTFPGTASSTGFVAKINPDGQSFGYATYFGSPGTGSNVVINALAVDSSGNAYITGNTRATDLPVTSNAPQPKIGGAVDDAFVFKLNPAASSILFGTYLGGIGADWGQGIGLDGSNNIYVAGYNTGAAFPTTVGSYLQSAASGGAAWVVKYSPDFKVRFSTYIANVNGMSGLAVDAAGNTYLAGPAQSTATLQTTPDAVKSKVDRNADGAQAWVAKLDPTGTRLLYGTYFGGAKDETVGGLAIDSDASIYISGETFSPDIPVSFNPVQRTHDANLQYRDAYTAQFVEIPWFDADHVANGASFKGGAIAPGEIITIYGFSLGPKLLKTYNITAGKFDSLLARTKITFDGVPAPVIYANWAQTSVVVPYSVAGKSTTQVVVEYKGRPSAPVTLQVAESSPGIFTSAANGSGQGAILLEDYSVNGPQNAVPRGRAAMVFMTVGGENGTDGLLAGGIAQHPLPVTATIGGKDAQVIYAGPSPGLIWGLTQVNVIVPDSAPTGSAVPITITVGNRSTQSSVTMAIK